MDELRGLLWPPERLGDAIAALARQAGFVARTAEIGVPPSSVWGDGSVAIGLWIETAARNLGVEAVPADAAYSDVEKMIRQGGPCLLQVGSGGEARILALARSSWGRACVLGPDLELHKRDPRAIRSLISSDLESRFGPEVDLVLRQAEVPENRRPRARQAILSERLGPARVTNCWLLAMPPGGSVRALARQARLARYLTLLLGCHILQYLAWIVSWFLIGKGALEGRLEAGWLLAWALLLVSLVPLRMLVTWAQGMFSLRAGAALKQRLLYGVLKLDPDVTRHQGIGQLLGRVLESEAVESLALNGGIGGALAALELVVSGIILALGAAGRLHVGLLVVTVTITVWLGWRYFHRADRWTMARLAMTHDLVEKMVGHRTRIAQEPRALWHEGEDQALDHYLALSQEMDRGATQLVALAPRGWLVASLVAITPAFVLGESSPASFAVSLGGILLALQALRRLVGGLWQVAGAIIAWKQIAPLFHAASAQYGTSAPLTAPRRPGLGDVHPVLEAHDIVFRYRESGEPVLKGCSLHVRSGDRLLLEGPSGGGKSTLASLLVGLRSPESGLLFLHGLDRPSIGAEAWRRAVVAAPQFHENHVFTETFAFNLLMGRRWPPEMEDLEEADALCRELGLGPLLDRMPAGLLQMVGETGWQLSHGERSRLYLSRALLQKADVVVLDESFAALDPENLERCLHTVLERAPTLVVIAHP